MRKLNLKRGRTWVVLGMCWGILLVESLVAQLESTGSFVSSGVDHSSGSLKSHSSLSASASVGPQELTGTHSMSGWMASIQNPPYFLVTTKEFSETHNSEVDLGYQNLLEQLQAFDPDGDTLQFSLSALEGVLSEAGQTVAPLILIEGGAGVWKAASTASRVDVVAFDGSANSGSPATLSVAGPLVVLNTYQLEIDQTLVILVTDLIANDLGDAEFVGIESTSKEGVEVAVIDGGIGYQTPVGFEGIDEIVYTIKNQKGATATGTILLESGNVQGGIAVVVARRLFYNNSRFDSETSSADPADDTAIAIDKKPLLAGETSDYENLSNYSKGINGVFIDVKGMGETPAEADFEFRLGNDDSPDGWTLGPKPSSISMREGAGLDSSDRVTIIWPDKSIVKKWLCIVVKPTQTTRLGERDVFYFGHTIGKTPGDSNFLVGAQDELRIRANPRGFFNPVPVESPFDLNRDTFVNAQDQLIARSNGTSILTGLRVVSPEKF